MTMGTDNLRNRSQKLEDAFFAKRDREKLAALREKLAAEAKVSELAAASGIEDREVLHSLVELDIRADTYTALSLVPLILVAWADCELDAKERKAVLQAAKAQGLKDGQPAHGLLASWLDAPPGEELKTAWFEYVGVLMSQLPAAGRQTFKHALLGGAERVARATGGFLGLGNKVSNAEQRVLDELSGAFDESSA